MRRLARGSTLPVTLFGTWFILQGSALAQDGSAPATAAFPPAPGQPAAAPSPAPVTYPAPLPPPPSAPPPGAAPVASPAGAPAYPPPPAYAQDPNPPPQYGATSGGYYGAPPPPPPQDPNEGFKVPDISLRIDPFNLLIEGRLGLELETELYKFISLELVPEFVTTKSPPTLNYASYDSTITQASNGIGALSGAAVDVGFWLEGRPLEGDVLRVGLSNYSYTYEARDDLGLIDSVSHTDRELFFMWGQHMNWPHRGRHGGAAFTIEGAIGLGYELNNQNRCFDSANPNVALGSCPKDQLLIKTDRQGNTGNLDGFLYPVDLLARLSLGVTF